MSMASRLSQRLADRALEFLRPRPTRFAWPGGVVSFSFDDVPASAFQQGGEILERRGVRGTYYVAAGLAGTCGDVGRMFEVEDLARAHTRGHELGCHTFGHLNCAQSDARTMEAEFDANAQSLSRLPQGEAPSSFAYPFGAVSSLARRIAGRRFDTCRGIRPGVNSGTLDRADLRANKIYAASFDEARARALIDQAVSDGGWVIFYTHDVAPAPSAYGCLPEQLEAVVAYAAARATVLPVRDVVARARMRRG